MFYHKLIVDFFTCDSMYAHNYLNPTEDNIEIAYWSKVHNSWILHKQFIKSIIIYNGNPVAFESKREAAKYNQMFDPLYYRNTK